MVIECTLASDNSLCFRKNLLDRIKKLTIKTDSKIRDEKIQYGTNREVAKILALSSGKSDKCEYPMGKEISPSDQRRII